MKIDQLNLIIQKQMFIINKTDNRRNLLAFTKIHFRMSTHKSNKQSRRKTKTLPIY
jgi:hypothetical protein